MTVYFTASIVGKRHFLENYLTIVSGIERHGHRAIAKHILETTERQLSEETPEERKKFHKKLDTWITDCDCMIVEASFPSISVGFEISLALNKGKAVLVLYTDGDPPSLLQELNNERLVIEKYSLESIHTILHDFFLYAQGSNETRFTFFLHHDQAAYLQTIARKNNMPKSVYLRKLIDKDKEMNKIDT